MNSNEGYDSLWEEDFLDAQENQERENDRSLENKIVNFLVVFLSLLILGCIALAYILQ